MRANSLPGDGEEGSAGRAREGLPASLRALVAAVAREPALDAAGLEALQRRYPKPDGFWSKREMLAAYRAEPAAFGASPGEIEASLRTCPTRSLSGVLPVTVLTKPFPCPGRCVFCPSDVRMPKSYVLRMAPGLHR